MKMSKKNLRKRDALSFWKRVSSICRLKYKFYKFAQIIICAKTAPVDAVEAYDAMIRRECEGTEGQATGTQRTHEGNGVAPRAGNSIPHDTGATPGNSQSATTPQVDCFRFQSFECFQVHRFECI